MRIWSRVSWLFLVFCLALSWAAPAAAQDARGYPPLEITLDATIYHAVPAGNGTVRLEMEGFQTALIPGYPALPVRVVDLALPPGAHATGVVLRDVRTENLGVGWKLSLVPPQASDDEQILQLELTEPFPSSPVELEGNHGFGGLAFARLRFYPFRYDPRTGELTLTSHLTVEVRYEQTAGPTLPTRVGDWKGLSLSNAAEAREWYATGPAVQASEGYLILTTSTLASSQAVQDFVSHKSSLGFVVYVATPSDWASYPGAEQADKIRNFLINRYGPWNLRWLLIVGNTSTIPMKMTYPSSSEHSGSWPTPTDAYYADLTGNWDADGDGYFGERIQDAADFTAELYVGRIPFDDTTTVASILQKTTNYDAADGDWRRRALLAMAVQGYTTGGAIQTDGGYLGEEMRARYLNAAGFSSYRLYEENPPATTLPHEASLTLANMTSAWGNTYGLVTWWGHGNRYGAYRRLLSGGNTYDVPFITYDDLSGLDNSKPSIVFQNSCLNAETGYTNLASELLKQGAVATVGGTSVTWYYLYWDVYNDGGNATMAYLFGQNLVSDHDPAGAALADMKATYAASYVWFNGDHQNLMSFNLHGDPSVGLWPRAATLEKPLSAGWNLIAFSNLSSSLAVEEAFASIAGNYTEVYTYDPLAPGDHWLRYAPGGPPEQNTLTEVDGDHGYWVYVAAECTLIVTAVPPASPSMNLYAGWNLVSLPKMNSEPIADALTSIAGKVLLVYTDDPNMPETWIRYNPSAPSWANGLAAFDLGVGYWIKVSEDVTWTP